MIPNSPSRHNYDVINSIILAENGYGTDRLDITHEHNTIVRQIKMENKNLTNGNVNICNVSTSIINHVMHLNQKTD